MRSITVGVHCRKSVFKALGHETLSRQMVAFIDFAAAKDVKQAWIALETTSVQDNIVLDMGDASKAMSGCLEGHTANQTVHLVPSFEEEFRQIASVLASNAGDERFFHFDGSV
jgi:hypothetical protein